LIAEETLPPASSGTKAVKLSVIVFPKV